ncbi:hypothetical protein D9M69_587640 [compost metagenome]
MVPAKMLSTDTFGSFSVDLTVNTEMPKGGVSKPISTAMTVMMPKWMRLKSRPAAIGTATGVMISRMELESRIMPSSSRITTYRNRKP